MVLGSSEFNSFRNLNRFDEAYSFLSYSNVLGTFSGENVPFKSNTDMPFDIYPNRAFFKNNYLTKGINASIEELISHELGKHNMEGQFDSPDPKNPEASIYPDYPDLGANSLGKVYPTHINTINIINHAVDRGYIKRNQTNENLKNVQDEGRKIAKDALKEIGK
jgi:hypothetical protein